MSSLLGGSGKSGTQSPSTYPSTVPGGGYWLTGGGANAPFEMGPTPFDLSSIAQSVMGNKQAVVDRYNQLGLSGSTMAGQDVTGADTTGQALTGQEQTADVSNPALNPALQPPINQLVGVQGVSSGSNQSTNSGAGTASALGSLLTAGGGLANAAGALGGTAAATGAADVGGSFLSDLALGATILA